jgi:probable HAF family extracellular repeat protein
LVLALCVLPLTAGRSAPPADQDCSPYYASTDLGALPGFEHTYAVAVNESSQVLCQALSEAGESRAFLWDGGVTTDLGTLDGASIVPYALNDSGQAVGAALESGGSTAFTWFQGVFAVLPTPDGFVGAEARAISNSGTVAGNVLDAGGGKHACLWEGGQPVLLPSLPGHTFAEANALNEVGQVAGTSFAVYDPAAPGHAGQGMAVVWQQGGVSAVGTLPGYSYSEAYGINDQGDVVGACFEAPAFRVGYVLRQGLLQPQGGSYPAATVVRAIDNHGRYAGEAGQDLSGEYGDTRFALDWQCGQPMPLSYSSPSVLSLQYRTVSGRNDAGQLVANATLQNEGDRAYLLTPTRSDLRVTMEVEQHSLVVGGTVSLRIKLSNLGPDPAFGPIVYFIAPTGSAILSSDFVTDTLWGDYNSFYAFLPDLPAGASHEGVVVLSIHSAGMQTATVSSTAPNESSSNGYRAVVSFAVPGTPLPELTGEWRTLDLTFPTNRPTGKGMARGVLNIYNLGSRDAAGVWVRLYVVEGPERRKRLLRRLRIGDLYAGYSNQFEISTRVRVRNGVTDARFLAEIDPDDQVLEAIESNNSALSAEIIPYE